MQRQKKNHRLGGKFCGNHTTLTDLGIKVADIANRCPFVTRISPGVIRFVGRKGAGRKVKMGDYGGGIVLTVCQARSVQEIRIFANGVSEAKNRLADLMKEEGIAISVR